MKRQTCQAKSEAKTWDDAISFARAKIAELKQSIRTFERMRDEGEPWRGDQSEQLSGPVRS
jgi:hypothetical protein